MLSSSKVTDLLTSGEAARSLGVSQVTVLTMANDGRLRVAARAGGNNLFAQSDVEALKKARESR